MHEAARLEEHCCKLLFAEADRFGPSGELAQRWTVTLLPSDGDYI